MHTYRVATPRNIFGKIKGLIGAEKAYPIFFKTRWGIHTFGLRFPIDVLILDSEYKTVKIAENLLPNKILLWPVIYENVLELPAGEIKRQSIHLGEKVQLRL